MFRCCSRERKPMVYVQSVRYARSGERGATKDGEPLRALLTFGITVNNPFTQRRRSYHPASTSPCFRTKRSTPAFTQNVRYHYRHGAVRESGGPGSMWERARGTTTEETGIYMGFSGEHCDISLDGLSLTYLRCCED